MDNIDKNENNKKFDSRMIHFSLSLSYLTFLFGVVFGVVLDLFIPLKIIFDNFYIYLGLALIILGSILSYWAQYTSHHPKNYKTKDKDLSDFMRGPYKYIRTPTHLGIFIMTLGLALLINSPFSVLFTLIAHLISKEIFIKKEESLLEKKHGKVFTDYKEKVGNWL